MGAGLECAAVLLGALGDPRVPGLEHARDILFGMRFGYDLYANVRPVKCLADRLVPLKGRSATDVDFVVFRENTEGVYVGVGGNFVNNGSGGQVVVNNASINVATAGINAFGLLAQSIGGGGGLRAGARR